MAEKNIQPDRTMQGENGAEVPGFIKKGKKILETVTAVYLIAVLFAFPIYYRNYYFDILDAKYQFFYVSALALMGITAVTGVIMFVIDTVKYENQYSLEFFSRFTPGNIRKTLTLPDWFLIAFLVIATLSTAFSDYRYESFWGNEGRYTGLFLLLLYGFSFFIVSRFLCCKRWIFDMFLVSSMLVCLFGITDYFNLNLLGFKDRISPEQYDIFVSFLGNINTYTAYISLVLGVSCVLYAGSEKLGRTIWYYVCTVIGLFAIVTGQSDNAYLALLALFGFLPFYMFGSYRGIKRYVVLLATFFTVIDGISLIEAYGPWDVLAIEGVFSILRDFGGLEIVTALLWIAAAFLHFGKKVFGSRAENVGRLPRRMWGGVVIASVVLLAAVLIDANLLGHGERYGVLQSYVVFNDDWGTHRGYIWKLGIQNYMDFSPIHKIFGYGPDTFGILTVTNNYQEMVDRYHEIFDSAHNEYLQYFVTIGPLGLAAYLGLLISSAVRMIRIGKGNPYIMATLFAVICYGAQAFVNINLPIATPVMWTLLMTGIAGVRKRLSEKEKCSSSTAKKNSITL